MDNPKTQDGPLYEHVATIARAISEGIVMETDNDAYDEDYPDALISGWDYLSDALDIQYVTNSAKEFAGVRILVAFGGPNIWVDMHRREVVGSWWGPKASAEIWDDPMGIEDAAAELFNCI